MVRSDSDFTRSIDSPLGDGLCRKQMETGVINNNDFNKVHSDAAAACTFKFWKLFGRHLTHRSIWAPAAGSN